MASYGSVLNRSQSLTSGLEKTSPAWNKPSHSRSSSTLSSPPSRQVSQGSVNEPWNKPCNQPTKKQQQFYPVIHRSSKIGKWSTIFRRKCMQAVTILKTWPPRGFVKDTFSKGGGGHSKVGIRWDNHPLSQAKITKMLDVVVLKRRIFVFSAILCPGGRNLTVFQKSTRCKWTTLF